MRREDLYPGQQVGYRWPDWVAHSGPSVADAIVVDPDWAPPPGQPLYEGERVQAPAGDGPRILFRLPGHHPELRAVAAADRFVPWGVIERHRRTEHFAQQGIVLKPGGGGVTVALIDPSDPSRWEPVRARIDSAGVLLVRLGSGEEFDDVNPRHLFGPAWIRMRADRQRREEAAAAERARRAALKADTAERLGLSRGAVSIGDPCYGGDKFSHITMSTEEVLLVISPAALAGLIERAISDPAWADQVEAEGVLDALAGLGET